MRVPSGDQTGWVSLLVTLASSRRFLPSGSTSQVEPPIRLWPLSTKRVNAMLWLTGWFSVLGGPDGGATAACWVVAQPADSALKAESTIREKTLRRRRRYCMAVQRG